MPDHEIDALRSGVQNLLSPELIATDAASDSSNWYTQDGKIKLSPGRLRIGTEGAVGAIQGEIWGYKIDGTKIHWRKTGTKIQYWNGTAWTDVVTGLTATADYTFCNYSSLAGTFTYAFGIDGIFKMHNAVPGSYLSLYDATKNFKGYAFIDKGRTILWNRLEDKTGLYGSRIDPQDGTVYTTVTATNLASGDGSTKTFTGTLSGVGEINFFGFSPYGQVAARVNISAITKASFAIITANSHGLSVGDQIVIQGAGGMVEINNGIGKVVNVVDANNIAVNINSSSFTAYTSGGTLAKIELFTDNYLGVLTGSLGGTGTINYLTGAWSVTFNTAPTSLSNNVQASYQFETSNDGGVTDFTHSGTRLAGEGFVFPKMRAVTPSSA